MQADVLVALVSVMAVLFYFMISVLLASAESVSSKLDFNEAGATSVVTNSTKTEDDDVEVKHTIVVSTKLKNNRRGLHSAGDPDPGTLTYDVSRPGKKVEDSSEVPFVYGYKSVDTTQIRSPDTRFKNKVYPDAVFINRNIRDQYDPYPNSATNPMQWKASNFFKNINWWSQDDGNEVYHRRNDGQFNRGTVKFHRKITDDGMKEFYCKRCRELSGPGPVGCAPQRRNSWVYQTTTPTMKLDGKLAKLN